MKGVVVNFLIGLLVVFAFAACFKQPVQEISAAKAAVDAAMADGAEKYSPAEALRVNDELADALAEVNTQDGKFTKDYKKAKEMLEKVKADAETLKAGLAAKKEEAKKQAVAAQEAAKSAVEEAKSSLAAAMRSKKASGLDALDAGAKGLDDSLLEVKNLIDTEDFLTAIEKADVVEKDAAALTEKTKQTVAEQIPKKKETKKEKHH